MTDEKPRAVFDDKFFANMLMSLLLAAILAIIGAVYAQGQATANALAAHLKDVADKTPLYVRKDDLGEINNRLQRIEDKLDRKADKR